MKHKIEWFILILTMILLFINYEFNIRKLLELLLTWTFAFTGYNLLVEYGFIRSVEKMFKKKTNKSVVLNDVGQESIGEAH